MNPALILKTLANILTLAWLSNRTFTEETDVKKMQEDRARYLKRQEDKDNRPL